MGQKAKAGLAAIFLANRAMIGRFLIARTGSSDDAEEVLQELWIKIDGLTVGPIDEPLAYLFRMAQNMVHDRRRSIHSRTNREQLWTDTHKIKAGSDYVDETVSVEQHLLDRERLLQIERLIDALPDKTSYVFRAFRVEGKGQKDIAAELGISLSTVEKHLQKAYRTIIDFKKGAGMDD